MLFFSKIFFFVLWVYCLGQISSRVVRHLLLFLLYLEVLVVSYFCCFVFSSFVLDDVLGFVFGFILCALAAADTCVGLGLFVWLQILSSDMGQVDEVRL